MRLNEYSTKHIHFYSEELPPLLPGLLKNENIQCIADLGCGDGSILYALLQKGLLETVDSVFAVDISQDRINQVQKIHNKIQSYVSDISNLDMFDDATLDLVISNQVLEHLPDEEAFLQEVYRVLQKDGVFYLSTVFKKWYGWYFYRCNGKWVLDPTHLREYTEDQQLLKILRKNHFQIIQNQKTLFRFPISDFILKRIGSSRKIYNANQFFRFARRFQVPILGYYHWALVLKKAH